MFARQVADTTCRFSCVHDELVLSFLPAAAATPTHAYVIGVYVLLFSSAYQAVCLTWEIISVGGRTDNAMWNELRKTYRSELEGMNDWRLAACCTQRATRFARRPCTPIVSPNLNQKWSGICFLISDWSELGCLPNRFQNDCGFIPLSALQRSVRWVSWKAASDCMRNSNKAPRMTCSVPQWWLKWKIDRIRTRDRITTKS